MHRFLNGNRLEYLMEDTFQDLERLEWIFLRDNQLSYVDLNVFRHLASIQWM